MNHSRVNTIPGSRIKFRVLYIILSLTLLPGCLYYRVIPKSPDPAGIEELSKMKKMIIVHSGDTSMVLSSLWVQGDSAYGHVKANYKMHVTNPGSLRYKNTPDEKSIPNEAHIYVHHLKKTAVPGYYQASFAFPDILRVEVNKKNDVRNLFSIILGSAGIYAGLILLFLPFTL